MMTLVAYRSIAAVFADIDVSITNKATPKLPLVITELHRILKAYSEDKNYTMVAQLINKIWDKTIQNNANLVESILNCCTDDNIEELIENENIYVEIREALLAQYAVRIKPGTSLS